jgi:hypothetical protein
MSSSTGILDALKLANKYLYQIGGPILMVIGTASCILNLIVYTQKNLRKNPCSIYLIAYNIANLAYIYSSLLPITLTVGYNVDSTVSNLNICRLRLYTTILSNCLSAFYLVFASIDRILITSRDALTRQRSTRRMAYLSLSSGTLFWSLFHIHTIIFANITQIGSNSFLCYYQQGVYLAFVSYYSLIKQILSFSLMLICGLWSIKNIQNTTRRITVIRNTSLSRTAVTNSLHSTSTKDRQFFLMLIMDITIYALFSFLFAIYLLYEQITQYYIKSAEQIQIENNVRNICLYGVSISISVSFYTNFIVSKTFRHELKNVFL